MKRNTTGHAAEGTPSWRSCVLGMAVLASNITGAGGAGNAAARSLPHDGGQFASLHQAESPIPAPVPATPASDDALGACLLGSWLHAWEEDTQGVIVYRPADYPFGPSRGRDGYEFLAGGALVYHGFGPADGPLTSLGVWAWTAPNQIHITVSDPQGAYIDETLRIVACDAETLQVQRLTDAVV